MAAAKPTSTASRTASRTVCSAGEAACVRRCTAEIARVDAGATVGIATTSGASAGRPRRGTNATPNPARTKAAFEAMMTMKTIYIAALEAAADKAG